MKQAAAARKPYAQWVEQNLVGLDDLPAAAVPAPDPGGMRSRQQAFGYTAEDAIRILLPMAQDGQEPISSMGTDVPLAVLSDRAQLLFSYFKQLFAQVTNPPIDPIREKIVMNTESLLGGEVNLLGESPEHARLLRLKSPTLSDQDMARIKAIDKPGLKAATISTLFPRVAGEAGLAAAMDRILAEAEAAVRGGATVLVLSDRGVDVANVPVPVLLAVSGVHHHLIRAELRTRCGIVAETGEAREVHHAALLIGFGAGGVNPYMVFETYDRLAQDSLLIDAHGNPLDPLKAVANYKKAIDAGLLKVFSKMGISTLMSYRGAKIFEAIGLRREVMDRYFPDTPSRIEGVGLEEIARESLTRHEIGFPAGEADESTELDAGGEIMWRRRGEFHMWNPDTVQLPPARRARQVVRHVQGLRAGRQRREPQALHAPRPARRAAGQAADPARTGRAGEGHRQAVLHRGDELRQHLEGGARVAGDRAQPRRGSEPTPARAAKTRPGSPRTATATAAAAPSSRWPAAGSASPRTTWRTPSKSRSRWPRGRSRARAASSPATRSIVPSPRRGTARRGSA